MPCYLAATKDDDGTIHPKGPVDGDDSLVAVLAAQKLYGPTCGVMPRKAVLVWLKGAAMHENALRAVTALEEKADG